MGPGITASLDHLQRQEAVVAWGRVYPHTPPSYYGKFSQVMCWEETSILYCCRHQAPKATAQALNFIGQFSTSK